MNIRQLMSLLKILEDVISALIWWGIYSTIAPHRKNKMDWVKKKKKKSVHGSALGQREYVFLVSKFIVCDERCKSALVYSFKL